VPFLCCCPKTRQQIQQQEGLHTNDFPNSSAGNSENIHDHFQDVTDKFPEQIHQLLLPDHYK
jgi:hypothetical protein